MKESSSRRLCAALSALSELAVSPARPPALGLFELEADILDVMVNHECMRGLCRDGGFCCLLAEGSALAPRGSINCCWRCWPRPRPSPSWSPMPGELPGPSTAASSSGRMLRQGGRRRGREVGVGAVAGR